MAMVLGGMGHNKPVIHLKRGVLIRQRRLTKMEQVRWAAAIRTAKTRHDHHRQRV